MRIKIRTTRQQQVIATRENAMRLRQSMYEEMRYCNMNNIKHSNGIIYIVQGGGSYPKRDSYMASTNVDAITIRDAQSLLRDHDRKFEV